MVIAACFSNLSFAESGKATIMVSANVVARISQSIIYQEPAINVTEGDIKRGFIEMVSGTILQIKTNARNGYALFFEGGNELFKEVMVKDKGRTVTLPPPGVGLFINPIQEAILRSRIFLTNSSLKRISSQGLTLFPLESKPRFSNPLRSNGSRKCIGVSPDRNILAGGNPAIHGNARAPGDTWTRGSRAAYRTCSSGSISKYCSSRYIGVNVVV